MTDPSPWDRGELVATHLQQPWQDVERAQREALDRLHAAVAEPGLPAAARARLVEDDVRRMLARDHDGREDSRERLARVLAARLEGSLELLRPELDATAAELRVCERYLDIAPGWAEGCEMEMSLLERATLRSTLALAANDEVAAATAIVSADLEHVILVAQLTRACAARTLAVLAAYAHQHEASYLAMRIIELSSASE